MSAPSDKTAGATLGVGCSALLGQIIDRPEAVECICVNLTQESPPEHTEFSYDDAQGSKQLHLLCRLPKDDKERREILSILCSDLCNRLSELQSKYLEGIQQNEVEASRITVEVSF